jgi:2-polyprenyl-3-methyl-5-hydroxy-6-metoxy-1,4-benzoquinol methylase
VAGDPRVRAYFDRRARLLDRLYDSRPGLRGRFEAWVYGPLRRRFELTLAELGDLTGKAVLDVGCGPGRYAVACAERGAEVVGVDISSAMLALAEAHARDSGVADRCRFLELDFEAFDGGPFDVALMLGVLEYLPDPGPCLARLHALTTEKAIVSVPQPERWQTRVRRIRHRLRPAPPSFHTHDPAEVARALDAAGFARRSSDRGWFVAYH